MRVLFPNKLIVKNQTVKFSVMSGQQRFWWHIPLCATFNFCWLFFCSLSTQHFALGRFSFKQQSLIVL